MQRQVHYDARQHIDMADTIHPSQRASFSRGNRLARLAWTLTWLLLFRLSPRPLHAWRAFLLRCFGAKLGRGCHIYPAAKVWAPWNLVCHSYAAIADGAEIYNPAPIHLGRRAILSQDSYICGATHDYNDPAFPLLAYNMHIGALSWICARATVAPGVQVGEGAVLGLASVATRDLDPWGVYAGFPAVRIKERQSFADAD